MKNGEHLVLMIYSLQQAGNIEAEKQRNTKSVSDAVTMPGIGPFAPQNQSIFLDFDDQEV